MAHTMISAQGEHTALKPHGVGTLATYEMTTGARSGRTLRPCKVIAVEPDSGTVLIRLTSDRDDSRFKKGDEIRATFDAVAPRRSVVRGRRFIRNYVWTA